MALDMNDTLEKAGIAMIGEYKLIYDYTPVSYPLLTSTS